jgi:hypothetical protein
MRTVLPDGTIRYKYKGHGAVYYRPPAVRKNRRHRPDDPRAVRFHDVWFLPLDLLPDEQRVWPETRPDSLILQHRTLCTCEVCQRPEAIALWRLRNGLRFGAEQVRRELRTPPAPADRRR